MQTENAKNNSLVTTLPRALTSAECDILQLSPIALKLYLAYPDTICENLVDIGLIEENWNASGTHCTYILSEQACDIAQSMRESVAFAEEALVEAEEEAYAEANLH